MSTAEQVGLLDADADAILAATARKTQVRCQRPDVVCGDLDVDFAVLVAGGLDLGVDDEPVGSQDAFGFFEQALVERIAGAEQQLRVDDTVARIGELRVEVRRFKRLFQGRLLRVPFIVKDIFRALRGLDWLVFGGGGLINDSNRTAVPLFALACLLARLRGAKIAWWSVGIGPLEGQTHRRLARWLLRTADFVTVRDQASAAIAAELLASTVPVAPDLAHALRMPAADRHGHGLVAISVIPTRSRGGGSKRTSAATTTTARRWWR